MEDAYLIELFSNYSTDLKAVHEKTESSLKEAVAEGKVEEFYERRFRKQDRFDSEVLRNLQRWLPIIKAVGGKNEKVNLRHRMQFLKSNLPCLAFRSLNRN